MTTKNLIIIRGPLAVGKTTIAKILAQKINADYFSLDQILKENNLEAADGIPLENFLKANEIIFNLTNKSKNTCIIDGCFYYQEQIDDLKKKFGDKTIIFTLMSDVEKCIERDSKRKNVYGEDATRYVHTITSKIQAGYEINNSNLSAEETVDFMLKNLDS